MAGSPGILIYAELLSNIRQISVGCSLPSAASPTATHAGISRDGLTLTVRHVGGEERTAPLPARAAPIPSLPVAPGADRLAWRLPLASTGEGAAQQQQQQQQQREATPPPWPATALEPGAAVGCRACGADVVPAGVLAVWKDLPSENWAEMMEFWHCHKPHREHGDGHGHDDHGRGEGRQGEDSLAARGYGANSRISAQPGTGFVDLTSFLFFERDCTGLSMATSHDDSSSIVTKDQTSNSSARQSTPVRCSTCGAELGSLHEQTTSVTLYKWQVSIAAASPNAGNDEKAPPPPSLANCVSSMLISTLSRSGCSKSIIQPLPAAAVDGTGAVTTDARTQSHTGGFPDWDPSSSLLHIWLFNKNIAFTSTARTELQEGQSGGQDGKDEATVPAVKVLYRLVSREEADQLGQSITSDVQDITLPDAAIRGVRKLLQQSTGFLPESDRKFGGLWSVGLLEKWKSSTY